LEAQTAPATSGAAPVVVPAPPLLVPPLEVPFVVPPWVVVLLQAAIARPRAIVVRALRMSELPI
jgi:hypothetical protein